LDSGVTQIDILKPEPEEYIDTMGYIFKANVSDLSGISEVKMQLLNSTGDVVRNGTMIPNEEKPGQYEFGSDLILARGFYTVVVNATDGLGNKGGATRLTYLDYSIQVLDWEGIQTQIDADEGGTVIIEYTVAARGGNIMRFTMGYISTLSPFMMNATVSNGYGVAAVRDVFEDSQPLQIGPSGQDPIVSTFNLTLTFTNETVQALTPGESYPISYAVWLDVEVT
ncbi:hypothetical protein KY343_07005, partial [Candidatus Woesearchaeota archaeon]|nr:hypothetical protein [Candidatus Woesearchaeota archaeon]